MSEKQKLLIVGLGNPILGDDAVGWKAAEQVEKRLQEMPPEDLDFQVVYLSLGGLRLMESLVGYEYVIIMDAITTGRDAPGTVKLQRLEDIPDLSAGHTTSVHDTSLQTALNFARKMGLEVPEKVDVVTVEAAAIDEFTEELTPEVARAVPEVVEIVMGLVSY